MSGSLLVPLWVTLYVTFQGPKAISFPGETGNQIAQRHFADCTL